MKSLRADTMNIDIGSMVYESVEELKARLSRIIKGSIRIERDYTTRLIIED